MSCKNNNNTNSLTHYIFFKIGTNSYSMFQKKRSISETESRENKKQKSEQKQEPICVSKCKIYLLQ